MKIFLCWFWWVGAKWHCAVSAVDKKEAAKTFKRDNPTKTLLEVT